MVSTFDKIDVSIPVIHLINHACSTFSPPNTLGFYEQQDPQQPEYNNRGLFTSDADGRYSVRCLVPTPYPIPFDSGAGDILKLLDRSPMRPAHIHFLIKAKGYKTLVTQVSLNRIWCS